MALLENDMHKKSNDEDSQGEGLVAKVENKKGWGRVEAFVQR